MVSCRLTTVSPVNPVNSETYAGDGLQGEIGLSWQVFAGPRVELIRGGSRSAQARPSHGCPAFPSVGFCATRLSSRSHPGLTRLPSWSSLPRPIAGPPVPAGSEDQGGNPSWPDRHQRLPRRCPDLNRSLLETPLGPPASGRTRLGFLTDTLSRQPGAPRRRTGPPYASSAGWFLSPARPSGFLWSHPDRSTAASRDP